MGYKSKASVEKYFKEQFGWFIMELILLVFLSIFSGVIFCLTPYKIPVGLVLGILTVAFFIIVINTVKDLTNISKEIKEFEIKNINIIQTEGEIK